MSFKTGMIADVQGVFLDYDFFGEKRNIKYDGTTYSNVPVVLTGGTHQKGRITRMADHSQGIFNVTEILHCSPTSIGNVQPEKGTILAISDTEGGTFYLKYYVAQSILKGGMLRVELEAVEE